MDSVVKLLIDGIKTTQEQINPYFKKVSQIDKEEKMQQNQDKKIDLDSMFKNDLQYEISDIPKGNQSPIDRLKKQIQSLKTQQSLYRHIIKQRNDQLLRSIQNEMYYMDTPKNKPVMWSKIILNDSNYNKNINKMFQSLIDPRLIFLDEQLTEKQINYFREQFINNEENEERAEIRVSQQRILLNIFKDMEAQIPQIPLYVTTKYGFQDIPGFFSVISKKPSLQTNNNAFFYQIPYDFDPFELEEAYEKNRENIIESRKIFDESKITLEKLKIDLKSKYNFKDIIVKNKEDSQHNQQQYEGNLYMIEEKLLFMKKVQKFFGELSPEITKQFQSFTLILDSEQNEINKFEIKLNYNFNFQTLKIYFSKHFQ